MQVQVMHGTLLYVLCIQHYFGRTEQYISYRQSASDAAHCLVVPTYSLFMQSILSDAAHCLVVPNILSVHANHSVGILHQKRYSELYLLSVPAVPAEAAFVMP